MKTGKKASRYFGHGLNQFSFDKDNTSQHHASNQGFKSNTKFNAELREIQIFMEHILKLC